MAIVKQLVELQGGFVKVQSKINQGSNFSIKIRYDLSKKSALKQAKLNNVSCNDCLDFSCLSNVKILLAEDNPINHLVTKDLLTDMGATGGKTDLVISSLKILEESLMEDSNNLRLFLAKGKINLLKNLAHKIKPNFILIGQEKLQSICIEIETTEDVKKIKQLVEKLLDSIPSIITKIKSELTKYE